MKVLITGGAGYIGSIMTDEMLRVGFEVSVLDNFQYRQASLAHLCATPKLKLTKGDVRDGALVQSLMKDADVIIPLAALVGAPICKQDPVGAETINKLAVLEMLKALSKDQLVIMPTTNSAYGTGDENNFCDETSELRPISKYAIDKVMVEKALLEHSNAVSLRLATVFGMSPRMRLDLLVNDFVYRAVHDRFVVLFESHFVRNYIHVRDVVSAFMFVLSNFGKCRGEIYNVGLSSANLSKRDLCLEIKKKLPSFIIHEEDYEKDPDQRNYIVSNAKIEALGFKTSWSLQAGIDELIKGYQMINNSVYSNV